MLVWRDGHQSSRRGDRSPNACTHRRDLHARRWVKRCSSILSYKGKRSEPRKSERTLLAGCLLSLVLPRGHVDLVLCELDLALSVLPKHHSTGPGVVLRVRPVLSAGRGRREGVGELARLEFDQQTTTKREEMLCEPSSRNQLVLE